MARRNSRKNDQKHNPLSKRKRGMALRQVEFLPPLTIEDCIEHLRAGRSPFEHLAMDVWTGERDFRVELIPRSAPPAARWSEGVWLEGHLETTAEGLTQVRARVLRDILTFNFMGLTAALLAVVWTAIAINNDYNGMTIGAGVGLAAATFALFWGMRRRWVSQLSHGLLAWLDERLDVRRDQK